MMFNIKTMQHLTQYQSNIYIKRGHTPLNYILLKRCLLNVISGIVSCLITNSLDLYSLSFYFIHICDSFEICVYMYRHRQE